MKNLLIAILLLSLNGYTQNRYVTRTGHVDFFSSTPVEDIKAENDLVSSILDISNGDFVFLVMMKSFEFEKALMQEHFNEKYINSDEFPQATFKGLIENFDNLDFNSLNKEQVSVSGELTIHGVTQKIKTTGYLTRENEKILGVASFKVKPEDFNISIPSIVREKIAKEITINVDVKLSEM